MKNSIDWTQYPNFSADEFRCKETGALKVDEEFLARLQALRDDFGKPMIITSGYRAPEHSIERKKPQPGRHTHGDAVDIALRGSEAFDLIATAIRLGFTGIGVSQKDGLARFIHLDTRPHAQRAVWSY